MEISVYPMPRELLALKSGHHMDPTRIVIHDSGDDMDAHREAAYMSGSAGEASFHYAVDESGAVACIPCDRNAWHAGDGGCGIGNREGIAVVICRSQSGGELYRAALVNAAHLCADILTHYGWPLSRLTKHQDYSGRCCPHRLLQDYGFFAFRELVGAWMTDDELAAAHRLCELGVTSERKLYNVMRRCPDVRTLLVPASRSVIVCRGADITLSAAIDTMCRRRVTDDGERWGALAAADLRVAALLRRIGGAL